MGRLIPTFVVSGVIAQFGLSRWAGSLSLAGVWICALLAGSFVVSVLEPSNPLDDSSLPRPRHVVGLSILFVAVLIAPLSRHLLTGDGFPELGLAHLAYDDYANWLANLSQAEAGEFEPRFGGIFNLFLILSLGLARAVHLVVGYPLTGYGVVVLALTFAVLLLGVLAGFACGRVYQGLLRAGLRAREAAIVSAAVLLLLSWFLRDVHRLGHLTAGLVVVIIVHEIGVLGSAPRSEERRWRLLVVVLATSLWFPLEPLMAFALLLLLFFGIKNRPRDVRWGGSQAIVGSALVLVVLLPSLRLPLRLSRDLLLSLSGGTTGGTQRLVESLLALPGATVTLHPGFLVAAAVLVPLSILLSGPLDPRSLIASFAMFFVVLVRAYDVFVNGGVSYGSIKLLWISTTLSLLSSGLVVVETLLFRARGSHQRVLSLGVVGLVLFLGLLPGGLNLIRKSWVYSPLSDAARIDAQTDNAWLSPGVFERSRPIQDLPKICLATSDPHASERFTGSYESYPCTRVIGGFGYASEPYAAESSIGSLSIGMALRGSPLSLVARHALEHPLWLTEGVLLIDPNGGVVREERLLDVLSQEFLTRPLPIEVISEPNSDGGCEPAPVSIDSRDGVLVGWASTDVIGLVVTDLEPVAADLDPAVRFVRDDVATVLGASERRSGFRSGPMEIPEGAQLLARMRDGGLQTVGDGRGCSSSSEIGEG